MRVVGPVVGMLLLAGCSPPPKPPDLAPSPPAIQKSERLRAGLPHFKIEGAPEDEAFLNSVIGHLDRELEQGVPAPFPAPDPYYHGHIFWDADVWVFPAAAYFPADRARVIPAFRVETMSPAAWSSLAWEVDRSGGDVTPAQSRKHLSGPGFALVGLTWAAALGLTGSPQRQRDLLKAAYASRTETDSQGVGHIRGVKSVDEYAESVDDDLVTNLLAEMATGRHYQLSPSLRRKSFQQACDVLAVWPLQSPELLPQWKSLLKDSRTKVSPYGPAMSQSLHALVEAKLGDPDLAYQEWLSSWKDFTDADLQFREYRKGKPRTYFLTGAAGCLNSVIYGFLGFQIHANIPKSAVWSKKLNPVFGKSMYLSIEPRLPQNWKRIEFRGFHVLGKTYSVIATQNWSKVIEGD